MYVYDGPFTSSATKTYRYAENIMGQTKVLKIVLRRVDFDPTLYTCIRIDELIFLSSIIRFAHLYLINRFLRQHKLCFLKYEFTSSIISPIDSLLSIIIYI